MAGFLSWVVLEWLIHKKPTILGGLSGLVGITSACVYVDIYDSLVIGALSSVFCYFCLSFIKYKLKWD